MNYKKEYLGIKVENVKGRYVHNAHILDFLSSLKTPFIFEELGRSVEHNPIFGITVGTGKKRILMWSQMHGNESTTTKALLDYLNFLQINLQDAKSLLEQVTLKIIPILNPDGAKAYTRVNSNGVDLNRDAKERTQPESQILRKVFKEFQPNFCFNLHDQRTIFNVGDLEKPATVSFLAPAFDESRNNSPSRIKAMQIIAVMNKALQKLIPNQIGRYDDSFNPNCVGDAFQMEEVPTILFEAGHFPEDYHREETRSLIYLALQTAITSIASGNYKEISKDEYLRIPENQKLFLDIVVKNAKIIDSSLGDDECLGILYKEVLGQGEINFSPWIAEKGFKSNSFFGHKTVDCLKESDLNWLKEEGILNATSC